MEWSTEAIKQLIRSYRSKEVLWNKRCQGYRVKDKRVAAFDELADEFKCSSEEVQRKIHNLRNQFSQELRKLKEREFKRNSKWIHFSSLEFLVPILKDRKEEIASEWRAKMAKENIAVLQRGDSYYLQEYNPSMDPDAEVVEEEHLTEAEIEAESEVEQEQVEEEAKAVRGQKRKIYVTHVTKQPFTATSTEDDETLIKFGTRPSTNSKYSKPSSPAKPDDDESFGAYVTMELRGLQYAESKRRLKTQIRRAILQIVEQEDALYEATTTTGNEV